MIKVDPPLGAPISTDPPSAASVAQPDSQTGAAAVVTASELTTVDDMIDLRSEVPTPYGGRLTDLEAILERW